MVGSLKKKEVFDTKSVRKRFHELSLGRNNRLGLGTSKIEVLPKTSKKKQGKSMILLEGSAADASSDSRSDDMFVR